MTPPYCLFLILSQSFKGAQLVRDSSNGAVYLTDFDGARHVTSPTAFDKYHFNWKKVVGISHATANLLKKGRDIS